LIDENGDISLQQLIVRGSKERIKQKKAQPVSPAVAAKDTVSIPGAGWPDAGMQPRTSDDSLRIQMAEKAASLSPGELEALLKEHAIPAGLAEEIMAVRKVNNDASALRDAMAESSDGPLKAYLLSIPPGVLKSITAAQLLQHLTEVAIDQGFSAYDINRALKEVNDTSSMAEKQLNEMISHAQGDFRDYLRTLDLEGDSIATMADLLNHLTGQAGEAFHPELLIAVISDMAGDRQVSNYIDFLIQHSPRNLRQLLRRLDPEKEDIVTIADLIDYLVSHAASLDMDEEELQQWALEMLAEFILEHVADDDHAMQQEDDHVMQQRKVSQRRLLTGGVLFTGLMLIIFVLLRRRREKNED